jgi:hypothetical protein
MLGVALLALLSIVFTRRLPGKQAPAERRAPDGSDGDRVLAGSTNAPN